MRTLSFRKAPSFVLLLLLSSISWGASNGEPVSGVDILKNACALAIRTAMNKLAGVREFTHGPRQRIDEKFTSWGFTAQDETRVELLNTFEFLPAKLREEVISHVDRLIPKERDEFVRKMRLHAGKTEDFSKLPEKEKERLFRFWMSRHSEFMNPENRALAVNPKSDAKLMSRLEGAYGDLKTRGYKYLSFGAKELSKDEYVDRFLKNIEVQLDVDQRGKLLSHMKTWPQEQIKRVMATFSGNQKLDSEFLQNSLKEFYETPKEVLNFRNMLDVFDGQPEFAKGLDDAAAALVKQEKFLPKAPLGDIHDAMEVLGDFEKKTPQAIEAMQYALKSHPESDIDFWMLHGARLETTLLKNGEDMGPLKGLNRAFSKEMPGNNLALSDLMELNASMDLVGLQQKNPAFKKVIDSIRTLAAERKMSFIDPDEFLAQRISDPIYRDEAIKFVKDFNITGPETTKALRSDANIHLSPEVSAFRNTNYAHFQKSPEVVARHQDAAMNLLMKTKDATLNEGDLQSAYLSIANLGQIWETKGNLKPDPKIIQTLKHVATDPVYKEGKVNQWIGDVTLLQMGEESPHYKGLLSEIDSLQKKNPKGQNAVGNESGVYMVLRTLADVNQAKPELLQKAARDSNPEGFGAVISKIKEDAQKNGAFGNMITRILDGRTGSGRGFEERKALLKLLESFQITGPAIIKARNDLLFTRGAPPEFMEQVYRTRMANVQASFPSRIDDILKTYPQTQKPEKDLLQTFKWVEIAKAPKSGKPVYGTRIMTEDNKPWWMVVGADGKIRAYGNSPEDLPAFVERIQ